MAIIFYLPSCDLTTLAFEYYLWLKYKENLIINDGRYTVWSLHNVIVYVCKAYTLFIPCLAKIFHSDA